MKKIILSFFLLTTVAVNAQRTCGMEQKMQQIMSDPIQKEAYLKDQQKFQIELEKLSNRTYRSGETNENVNATIRIPIAVHYPSVATNASAALKTCLRNLAQNQVNILNADYNATNTDVSNWNNVSSLFPMVNGVGSIDVEFVLATQNHPAAAGIANGTVAVTFGTDFLNGADQDFTWTGYVNIVVRYANGNLGYSVLGGSPNQGHTVVIDTEAFGSGAGCTDYVPGAPYNKGRTLTHELGHYFNLDHTFNGCGETNCAVYNVNNPVGDGICDTPPQTNATGGCPNPSTVMSCTSGQRALSMNYMDYTNDNCMYMFTPGQATRMLARYNTIAGQIRTNTLSNNEVVKNNFTIAPNPNNGSFTIQFKDLSNDYSVEIFDVSGRMVYENYYTLSSNLSQEITLDKPSSGLYFVNVKSGSVITTEKIIIK
ncbi:zinc-dependent metalloprotease [Flavobacterium dankookense]|uniref:Putative secreted protein (Por secretion system target) n=1 Tax=Flavobacterium dankookense TaxID=706186 RepID=A0A4R6Q9M5_9FLAO|nr:zinc-dependent metalloprotease [Flavobacterium dankookense]TDP58880.1 putative secreted protein (Por secretion system target) [Flavobacterium dankookense]